MLTFEEKSRKQAEDELSQLIDKIISEQGAEYLDLSKKEDVEKIFGDENFLEYEGMFDEVK